MCFVTKKQKCFFCSLFRRFLINIIASACFFKRWRILFVLGDIGWKNNTGLFFSRDSIEESEAIHQAKRAIGQVWKKGKDAVLNLVAVI